MRVPEVRITGLHLNGGLFDRGPLSHRQPVANRHSAAFRAPYLFSRQIDGGIGEGAGRQACERGRGTKQTDRARRIYSEEVGWGSQTAAAA